MEEVIQTIAGPILVIAFILLVREICTWYWKLNKIVTLLEEISKKVGKSGKVRMIPVKEYLNKDEV